MTWSEDRTWWVEDLGGEENITIGWYRKKGYIQYRVSGFSGLTSVKGRTRRQGAGKGEGGELGEHRLEDVRLRLRGRLRVREDERRAAGGGA